MIHHTYYVSISISIQYRHEITYLLRHFMSVNYDQNKTKELLNLCTQTIVIIIKYTFKSFVKNCLI